MAHELSIREDGFVEFAFTGERNAIWHGLGNQMEDASDFQKWKEMSGMDWMIKSTKLNYNVDDKVITIPNKNVLYRSDTGADIGIVSNRFKVVQPNEILDFFQEVCEKNKMKMSTAGVLFGGRRFWGLAEINAEDVKTGDTVKNNILLMTGTDGTYSTTAKHVSTRVVCNNTLEVAMSENDKNVIRVRHSQVFDAKKVMLDMDLIQKNFEEFMQTLRTMSDVKMTGAQQSKFVRDMILGDQVEEEIRKASQKKIDEIMMKIQFGDGAAQFGHDSVYGLLNGITNVFTHGYNSSWKSKSKIFDSSSIGEFNKIKTQSFLTLKDMLETV